MSAKKFRIYDVIGTDPNTGDEKVIRSYDAKLLKEQEAPEQDPLKCAQSFVEGRPGLTIRGRGAKADENDEGDEDDVESYDALTLDELKKECEARKLALPAKPKKAALVKLLEKYDEEHGEEE